MSQNPSQPSLKVSSLSFNPLPLQNTVRPCLIYLFISGSCAHVLISTPDVRMRYQNKNMLLPMCSQKGDHLEGHPEFCTFDAFKARVNELTPDNWDMECSPAGRVL